MDLKQTLTILDELQFESMDMAWRFIAPHFSGEKPYAELRDTLSMFKVKPAAIMGRIEFGVNETGMMEQMDILARHMDAADKLGVNIIRVFASHIPECYIDEAIIQRVINNMRRACASIEKTNVTLAIENHFGLTATAEDVLNILNSVNSPRLGLTFDPANFVVSGEDPVSAAEKLAKHITHTHLKDCIHTGTGRWSGYDYVEVGAGNMDYRGILSKLEEYGYNGYLALEYEQRDDVVRGTLLARKNLAALMSLTAPGAG